ncbi:MAG: methyltransferase domain-containing protein [Rhodospirillales bacterium]|nr:methyltransferase domain-containing protein [Rhodospirillales bacterium]
MVAVNSPTLAHREIWLKKKSLRLIYSEYCRLIQTWCVDGPTLEIGSGIGNLKQMFSGKVVSIDIQSLPWLDAVADAHALPFSNGYFANIVMIDTLHHLAIPQKFFSEASRLLRPGGRIVVLEPAITLLSYPVYKFLHPEPVRMNEDPLKFDSGDPDPKRDPFDANQAIPTLLFERHPEQLERRFPELQKITCYRFDIFTYVLSGGFRRWTLVPGFLVPFLLRLEEKLPKILKQLMAFRLLCVLERI